MKKLQMTIAAMLLALVSCMAPAHANEADYVEVPSALDGCIPATAFYSRIREYADLFTVLDPFTIAFHHKHSDAVLVYKIIFTDETMTNIQDFCLWVTYRSDSNI